MYADAPTKLPLADFARFMGMHPLHFAQVTFQPTGAQARRLASNCDVPVVQYSWQNADAVGRDEIARAIADAEAMLEKELGFRLLPSWEVEEWRPTVRPWKKELFNLSNTDLRGFDQAVKVRWGWLVSGGRRSQTLIEAASPVVYTDADADGYDETATVTAAVAASQDAAELRLFYPGKSGAPKYEIRPLLSASVAGLVATITFRRENAVLEDLQEEWQAEGVDGADDANFLTTADVYAVANDPQEPAHLLWENIDDSCDCGQDSCPKCSFATQVACLNIRGDPKNGWFSYWPATWDASAETFSAAEFNVKRQPDAVRLWYLAGHRDKSLSFPNRDLDPAWARTVAVLAASLLDRPPCECVKAGWERWARDLAFSGGAEELATYNLSSRLLDNPFGTQAGAVHAWRQVLREGEAAARVAFV